MLAITHKLPTFWENLTSGCAARPQGYKFPGFFLNSTEHVISTAHTNVTEYDQAIPQAYTEEQPTALRTLTVKRHQEDNKSKVTRSFLLIKMIEKGHRVLHTLSLHKQWEQQLTIKQQQQQQNSP